LTKTGTKLFFTNWAHTDCIQQTLKVGPSLNQKINKFVSDKWQLPGSPTKWNKIKQVTKNQNAHYKKSYKRAPKTVTNVTTFIETAI